MSIKEWLNSTNGEIKTMDQNINEKFEKYLNVVHRIITVAIVLDPRYKLKLMHYYFSLFYVDYYTIKIEKICSFYYTLVKDYQLRSKTSKEVV